LNFEWRRIYALGATVPALAIIKVKVYDKDENQYMDDYIGKFKITDVYVGGQRDIPISSLLGKNHGTFRIEVNTSMCPNVSLCLLIAHWPGSIKACYAPRIPRLYV
jgi:hypothetical protein